MTHLSRPSFSTSQIQYFRYGFASFVSHIIYFDITDWLCDAGKAARDLHGDPHHWSVALERHKELHVLGFPVASPGVLAVGYVIGFFLVGQFVFRALLHDLYLINSFSGPSVLRVMLVLLLLYSLATILIAAASGKLYKRT